MTMNTLDKTDTAHGAFLIQQNAVCSCCTEDDPPLVVVKCPACNGDFCNECTDLDAWMNDLVTCCTHCEHTSMNTTKSNEA